MSCTHLDERRLKTDDGTQYGGNMNQPSSMNGNGHRPYSFTARDVVAIGFRHQRVMVLCFVGDVAGVLLSALAPPTKYRAETKLLVKSKHVDPIIIPDLNARMVI